MNKSGFNGYKTKSANPIGKKNIADKYSTIDGAIKSILGSDNVQIFTTLSPSTLILDASNNVVKLKMLMKERHITLRTSIVYFLMVIILKMVVMCSHIVMKAKNVYQMVLLIILKIKNR